MLCKLRGDGGKYRSDQRNALTEQHAAREVHGWHHSDCQ
jgi:hypothetical protein